MGCAASAPLLQATAQPSSTDLVEDAVAVVEQAVVVPSYPESPLLLQSSSTTTMSSSCRTQPPQPQCNATTHQCATTLLSGDGDIREHAVPQQGDAADITCMCEEHGDADRRNSAASRIEPDSSTPNALLWFASHGTAPDVLPAALGGDSPSMYPCDGSPPKCAAKRLGSCGGNIDMVSFSNSGRLLRKSCSSSVHLPDSFATAAGASSLCTSTTTGTVSASELDLSCSVSFLPHAVRLAGGSTASDPSECTFTSEHKQEPLIDPRMAFRAQKAVPSSPRRIAVPSPLALPPPPLHLGGMVMSWPRVKML